MRPHLLAAAVIGLCLVLEASAQVNYNQRDDKYRVLGLKRAKEAYEAAKRDYERQQELFTRSLISQAELDQIQEHVRRRGGELPAIAAGGPVRAAVRLRRQGGEVPGAGRRASMCG